MLKEQYVTVKVMNSNNNTDWESPGRTWNGRKKNNL